MTQQKDPETQNIGQNNKSMTADLAGLSPTEDRDRKPFNEKIDLIRALETIHALTRTALESHALDTFKRADGYGATSGVRPLNDVERDIIEHAIDYFDGSIPKAAKALQLSPSTIYRKLEYWAQCDSETRSS